MEKTEKVRIEELSVGDWVQDFKGNTAKIIGIELWSGAYEVDVRINVVDVGLVSASSCYPIPLTPEILEKNGFERKKYTIDIADEQEIEYDGYRHILCQDGVQYDIILVDSFGGYFNLEIESSHRDNAGERILISSKLSLDYVEFVHQLQRAMKLAGIEKEIIL